MGWRISAPRSMWHKMSTSAGLSSIIRMGRSTPKFHNIHAPRSKRATAPPRKQAAECPPQGPHRAQDDSSYFAPSGGTLNIRDHPGRDGRLQDAATTSNDFPAQGAHHWRYLAGGRHHASEETQD